MDFATSSINGGNGSESVRLRLPELDEDTLVIEVLWEEDSENMDDGCVGIGSAN